MTPKRIARAGLLLAVLTAAPLPAQSPATEYEGAAALGLALRKLGTTQRVLMIAAHPDDEDTQLLSALALGQGADVAYLSLTRGEGGQNGIGPELQEALGVIRSEELLAARRLDGAAQFFTRAYDYGFSKSADEAFRHWPRDSLLADVVARIRAWRPDVVVAVFTGTPRDGHGQHQASGILAREAVAAAADPARFPEQIARGLRPHRTAKFYESAAYRSEGATLRLPIGALDPLLGRSHFQVAMASRSRHASQDMGRLLLPGPRETALRGAPGERSVFEGVDTTLAARARASSGNRAAASARATASSRTSAGDRAAAALAAYDSAVAPLRAALNALDPAPLVPGLARAMALLERADSLLAAGGDAAAELRFHTAAERGDLQGALARAAGLVFDAVADDETVVPGQRFTLELALWNGGAHPVTVRALEPALPAGWEATPASPLPEGPLAPGTLLARKFEVRVPADAPASEPYFLRRPREGDLYAWPADPALRGLAFEPAEVRARAAVEVAGAALPLEREAVYRGLSSTRGEFRRPVRVVPAVAVTLEPRVAVLALPAATADKAAPTAPLRFTVRLAGEAPGGAAGTVRLELPAGWRAEPERIPVRFTGQGERRVVEFAVTPPAGTAAGDFDLGAAFVAEGGARHTRGAALVDYPHIRPRPLPHEATARVRAFELAIPAGLRIGYIMGASDAVPASLAGVGIGVELLDPAALAGADLDAFDVIVVGSRAYEHRADLAQQNRRLLEYAERGGTLVVQYNQYEFSTGNHAPYPLAIARPHDRVTDETAPVRLLAPDHPVLSWPNRIGGRDFEGWVQERGLYFPRTWDARYTPLLEMADPGEEALRGGLLVARHGRGTYVYTGLAFFRQLPAGVPGAYRLFANLLSLGVKR